jgi:urease accessory protein
MGAIPERTLHLHLFLHSRSILSSAVRLNLIGPYIAHRYLLHDIKPMIDKVLARPASSTTSAAGNDKSVEVDEPVNTWPLGEILAARHDCMHSRIFNS